MIYFALYFAIVVSLFILTSLARGIFPWVLHEHFHEKKDEWSRTGKSRVYTGFDRMLNAIKVIFRKNSAAAIAWMVFWPIWLLYCFAFIFLKSVTALWEWIIVKPLDSLETAMRFIWKGMTKAQEFLENIGGKVK